MVYAIIGRRKQGKSTLMRFMGSRVPARMIFDPRRMFRADAHAVVATTREEFELACDRLLDQDVSEVVYSPSGSLQHGFGHFSEQMKRWIEEEPNRPIAFMIDEANKDFLDTDNDAFQWAMRCCHWEIHQIMLTTHRPVDLTTKVRALVDHWCLFAVRQEHDLGVVRERCSVEVANIVQQLAMREFVHWDDTTGRYEIKRDAESWRCTIGSPVQIELPDDDGSAGLGSLPGDKPVAAPQGKLFM